MRDAAGHSGRFHARHRHAAAPAAVPPSHNRCVDSFTEIAPIPIVPLIVIIAAVGAFIAYRSRRRSWAVVLAVIVAVLMLYEVVWTFTPA
jgi:hypothetical protein